MLITYCCSLLGCHLRCVILWTYVILLSMDVVRVSLNCHPGGSNDWFAGLHYVVMMHARRADLLHAYVVDGLNRHTDGDADTDPLSSSPSYSLSYDALPCRPPARPGPAHAMPCHPSPKPPNQAKPTTTSPPQPCTYMASQ